MTDEYCVGTQRLARTNDQEDVETADNVVDRAQIEALMHETKVSIGASDDEIIDARTMAVVVRYVKLSSKRGISGIIVCVPRLCACHRPSLTHARRRRVPILGAWALDHVETAACLSSPHARCSTAARSLPLLSEELHGERAACERPIEA